MPINKIGGVGAAGYEPETVPTTAEKPVNAAVPALEKGCGKGQHFPEGTLEARATSSNTSTPAPLGDPTTKAVIQAQLAEVKDSHDRYANTALDTANASPQELASPPATKQTSTSADQVISNVLKKKVDTVNSMIQNVK